MPESMLDPRMRKRLGEFSRRVGRAIMRYEMLSDGDRVLLGVSGGKDSLCLALALRERLRWVPIRYDLHALLVQWREYPLLDQERARLEEFFARIDVSLTIVDAAVHPPSFGPKFDCYLCARNRKRILFDHANTHGFNKVALGHHLDDVVETTIMNLCFQGQFATMMPRQRYFGGRLELVRPLCETTSREIESLARRLELPVIQARCPTGGDGLRRVVRGVIGQLSHHNKRVRRNIYRSPWHINHDYLPSSLKPPGGAG